MTHENFNLSEVVTKQSVKLSLITAEDELKKTSRLRLEEAHALHTRQKEWLIYKLTALILLIVVGLCTWIILSKGLANDEGKLALGLLTSVITGLVGYVTGKAASENKSK